MNTVICLGGGPEALPIIRRVKEMGHRAVVVDGNPNAPGFALADTGIIASCYDVKETVRKLREFKRPHEIVKTWYHAVLCCAIDAPHVAATVAQAFDLPGLSGEAAKLGTDKYAQIQAFEKAGVPVPWFSIPPSVASLGAWPFAPANELVVKPLDSRGARGVARLLRGQDVNALYEQARAQSPTGRVMVEEWLDGPQLSTESIVQAGEVLFTAVGLRNYARLDEFAPYCIEDGFDAPYTIPDTAGDDLLHYTVDALIERACRVLGWYQQGGGTVKGDLVIHNGKVHVIELAPRLSGGFFCLAHEWAYGVDFIGAAVRLALGEKTEAPQVSYRGFVSQRYVFPSKDEIGKTLTAFDAHLLSPAKHFTWNKPIGYRIEPVTSHAARLGQAMTVTENPYDARNQAEVAVAEMAAGIVVE